MTRARLVLRWLLLVPLLLGAAYGQLTYGYDRKNWDVVCKDYPVADGEAIPQDAADALAREGWIAPAHPSPAASDVNHLCHALSYSPTRPDPSCPACPTP